MARKGIAYLGARLTLKLKRRKTIIKLMFIMSIFNILQFKIVLNIFKILLKITIPVTSHWMVVF